MNKNFKSLLTVALLGAGCLTTIAPTQASEISFSDLPSDMMLQLASYLTPYELGRFEKVSRGCQALCTPSMWEMVAQPFKDDYESTDIWNKDKVVVHLLRMKLHALPLDSAQSEIGNMRNKYPTLLSVPHTKYCPNLYKFFLHTNGLTIRTELFNSYTILKREFDEMTNQKGRKEFLESLVAENNQSAIVIKYEELMNDGGIYAKDFKTKEDRLTATEEFLESLVAKNNQWAIERKYRELMEAAQGSEAAALQFLDKLAVNGSRLAQYLYAFHIACMKLEPDMEKIKKYIQDYYIGF